MKGILDCFEYMMATLRGQIIPDDDDDDLEAPQWDCQECPEIIEGFEERDDLSDAA